MKVISSLPSKPVCMIRGIVFDMILPLPEGSLSKDRMVTWPFFGTRGHHIQHSGSVLGQSR